MSRSQSTHCNDSNCPCLAKAPRLQTGTLPEKCFFKGRSDVTATTPNDTNPMALSWSVLLEPTVLGLDIPGRCSTLQGEVSTQARTSV